MNEHKMASKPLTQEQVEAHMLIMEQVGSGCTSGSFAEWPQLRPACKWAATRIAALEAELRDEKYGRAIANVAAMGEVAAESVELVRQQDVRIAALQSELALRDRLEAAGYSINREYNNWETWTARRWGVTQSQHNTADEARAAAVRLLEGDAT